MIGRFLTYLWHIVVRTMVSIQDNQHEHGKLANLSPTCKLYITGLIVRTLERKWNHEDTAFLHNSGRFPNELGYFHSCSSTPNMAYYLVQAGADILRMNVGVCFSKQCTEDDWNLMRGFLSDKLTEVINRPHSIIAKVKGYLVVNVNRVEAVAKTFVADPLTVFFVATFATFTFLVLVASIAYCCRKRRLPYKKTSTFLEDQELSGCADDLPFATKSRSWVDIFALQANWRDIMDYKAITPHQLTVDFLRIFCVMGVFATSFAFTHALFSKIFFDITTLNYFLHSVFHTVVQGSLYIPDLYLFIGGHNCLRSAIRSFDRSKASRNKLWYPLYHLALVIKRFVKFSLPLSLTLTYLWKVMPQITHGPLSVTDLSCTKGNFLTSTLLLNSNFAGNDRRMCGPWYWYLAVDFQLFLFVPFIAFLFRLMPQIALLCSGFLSLGGLTVTLAYNQFYGVRILNIKDPSWITEAMTQSYVRSFCYFLGCFFCLIKLHRDSSSKPISSTSSRLEAIVQVVPLPTKVKINKKASLCSLIGGLLVFSVALYYFYNYFQTYLDTTNYPQWAHSLYNGAMPSVFALSVFAVFAGIVYSCFHSMRPCLNRSRTFLVLRAVYFEVFLLSMPFILTCCFTIEQMPQFSAVVFYCTIIFEFMAVVCLSLGLRLLITAPIDKSMAAMAAVIDN